MSPTCFSLGRRQTFHPQRLSRSLWPKAEVECGAMKPVINSARPMAPRFPGPLGHPPWPSLPLVQVWRHFATFFLARWGGTCAQGPKQGVSTLRADPRGYGAGKVRFRGPQFDPSNGPIAGLVECDAFFLTPLLGYGGCSKTP